MRWLHLSDFHFEPKDTWDQRAILKALLRRLAELKSDGLAPDLVFLTGDFANRGAWEEFEQALRFCDKLAETLDLDPAQAFFVVPGNHDVERSAIGPMDGPMLHALRSQEDIERLFQHRPTLKLIGQRLENFYAFTERLLGAARGWHADRPWRVDEREIGGLRTAILQLNSAWTSGSSQSGNGEERDLLIGEAQIQEALEEASTADVRIALIHHPVEDLRDFDRERVEELLVDSGVPFLLRGHLHRSAVRGIRSPRGEVIELAAGATHTHGKHEKTFLLTEMDTAAGEARIRGFRYAPRGKGDWIADIETYSRSTDGIWTLPLPEALRLGDGAAAPTPVTVAQRDARRATLAARYRAAVAAVYGTVRFVGFADHRKRPNVRVPELFVPLRVAAERGDKEAEDWSTADLLQRLASSFGKGEDHEKSAERIVVLGDPGSGKTTLCRYLAVALAGEADCEVDIPDDVLPLFLPFREYVRLCHERGTALSLVDFLVDEGKTRLQVSGLDEETFLAALDAGRAVLLLDGLDEVGSPRDREEMRDRMVGFCGQYPRVPVLVTSRFAGYDEAPLARAEARAAEHALARNAEAFAHLRLEPFSDDDLAAFVRSWYAVQEADDPVERDRGVADLLGAVQSDARVRELARNPMLATLIALVHRYEAHLPGERATLYDLCVKTMLETWPASKKREFREIDSGLQRAYLEALAYRMQCERSGNDKEVVIGRRELVDALTEIVRERQRTSQEPEVTRKMVERWVVFLEQGTGLLVEQRAGVFAFFHLSLLEFLAAEGMAAKAERLEEMIVERFQHAEWREVCLLAVGARATNKPFLDRLFKIAMADHSRRLFLCACLLEEAAFDDNQRDLILQSLSRGTLYQTTDEQEEKRNWLIAIIHLSMRHSDPTLDWLEFKFSNGKGEDLQNTAALCHETGHYLNSLLDPIRILSQRQDSAMVAADLLVFWPGNSFGDWAAQAVDTQVALCWLQESPAELRTARAIGALSTRNLVSHCVIAQTEVTLDLTTTVRAAQELYSQKSWQEGQPFTGVTVEPAPFHLAAHIAQPGSFSRRDRKSSAKGQPQDFAQELMRQFIKHAPGNTAGYLADYFTGHFAQKFATDFSNNASAYIRGDLAESFATDFSTLFAGAFGRSVTPFYIYYFDYEVKFKTPNKPRPPKPPTTPEKPLDAIAWSAADQAKTRADFLQAVVPSIARLAGEARIALAAVLEAPFSVRYTYFNYRVQNAALLQFWPAIDKILSDSPTPDELALYLTLGWTQATTTHDWPATKRWISIASTEPDHWLPRSQWLLTWLLYAPDDLARRQALDAALEEGLADPERPGIAAALRERFPRLKSRAA